MLSSGAQYLDDNRCEFIVWAPGKNSMTLHIVSPSEEKILMNRDEDGYFRVEAEIPDQQKSVKYFYLPDNERAFPDPASHYQPDGVHGPSQVIRHSSFKWSDQHWHGLLFRDLIFYEIHVGTFTPDGTFEAIIPLLDELVQTGINAIELMPVTQFPGTRNWGYDGAYPYAVHNSYGGPEGLKNLVNECHKRSIAVFLDTVYNHLGAEGNYFERFGPYFTQKYFTPWGKAINLDADWSDGVRDYFSDNAVHWFENYHIDGLRMDAIHAIFDSGAVNFWEIVNNKIETSEIKTGRKFYLVAESDLNSPRVVAPFNVGGWGFRAQWLDDFHHALYALLDREGNTRYEDFGQLEQLSKALTEGFVHSGEYVKFRKRKFGASSSGISPDRFVVFNLNHDQVGNRVNGERLSVLVSFEKLKLAAAVLLLSPYVPLLFMGEEYAEDSPFYYFIDFSDAELIKAVREGRKKEFENYKWETDPPDPQDPETFRRSKIHWEKRNEGNNCKMLGWHRTLIKMRATLLPLRNYNRNDLRINLSDSNGFMMHRKSADGKQHLVCYFNFSEEELAFSLPTYTEEWDKILDSRDEIWLTENTVAVPEGGIQSIQHLPQKVKSGESISIQAFSVAVYKNNT